jgi:hypothetical protein
MGSDGPEDAWQKPRRLVYESYKICVMKKFLGILSVLIVLFLLIFFIVRYYWVFGDGVKAGTLNYIVHKGYIFKTYEGELIQTGLQSKAPNSLMSNEFTFSIDNEAVAKRLELASGKEVQLHYKEYVGALPWRGYSKFVVDSVISIAGVR